MNNSVDRVDSFVEDSGSELDNSEEDISYFPTQSDSSDDECKYSIVLFIKYMKSIHWR
jgi:hypothetical protein